jgi:hypothetical protein
MKPFAEMTLCLADSDDKVGLRLYEPQEVSVGEWACIFEVDAPLELSLTTYGVFGMQALMLALKRLSAYLYGSEEYRTGRLGIEGEFGGNLGIPATHWLHDVAPFPF